MKKMRNENIKRGENDKITQLNISEGSLVSFLSFFPQSAKASNVRYSSNMATV